MEPVFTSSTSTTPSGMPIPGVGLSVESPLSNFLSGLPIDSLFSLETILNFLDALWSIYALIAYIVSIILLLLYVYAATQYKQLGELQSEMVAERERIYDERFRSGPKNDRLTDAMKHIESDNPNDWKLAIIEADIILDEALKQAGYAGVSLGERLRSISPSQLRSLDDAWQAHKVRNQVAHGGADFVLTHRLAEETIKQYRRVFVELGVM